MLHSILYFLLGSIIVLGVYLAYLVAKNFSIFYQVVKMEKDLTAASETSVAYSKSKYVGK